MKRAHKLLIMLLVLALLVGSYFIVANLTKETEDDIEKETLYDASDLDADTVKALSYTNGTETCSFEKDGDIWHWSGNTALAIDNDKLADMAEKTANLAGYNRLENVTKEKLSDYGLDEPILTVTVTDSKRSQTFEFGSYNSMIEAYYITCPDYPTVVFTADKSVKEAFDFGVGDLITKDTLPEIKADNVKEITLAGLDSSVTYTAVKTPKPTTETNDIMTVPDTVDTEDSYLYSATRTENGVTTDVSYADVYRLAQAIGEWNIDTLVSFDGTQDSEYGFDSPSYLTVNYTAKKEYDAGENASAATVETDESITLVLGSLNSDGTYYCKVSDNSPLIYKLSGTGFAEIFAGKTVSD